VNVTFTQTQPAPAATMTQPAPPPAASPQTPRPPGAALPVLGTVPFEEDPEVTAQVNEILRSRDGYVSVLWSLHNNGIEELNTGAGFQNEVYDYRPQADSGLTITDPAAGRRFHPIMDAEAGCVCSPNMRRGEVNFVEPGESVIRWSVYRIPAPISGAVVAIDRFGTVENVAVP
jgi:hypothetical protein